MPIALDELNCDFCAAGQPVVCYIVTAFHFTWPSGTPEAGETMTNQHGGWAACGMCKPLVDGDRLNVLIERSLRYMEGRERWTPLIWEMMRKRQRLLLSHVLRQRSEAYALDAPEALAFRPESADAPMGIHFKQRADGAITDVVIEPRVPRPRFERIE